VLLLAVSRAVLAVSLGVSLRVSLGVSLGVLAVLAVSLRPSGAAPLRSAAMSAGALDWLAAARGVGPDRYLISVAADTFDGDWEWVQSPKKPPLPRSSDSEMPAGQDSEPEASAPQETLTLFLENVSGENDLAELYRITCKAPPAKVNMLLAAVCVALRVPPQPSASNHRGSYFAAGRALLRDSTDLLFRLSSFNPEELLVDGERRRKIKKAIKSLSVPSVKKVCSSAGGLAQWLHTIDARTDAAEQRATALRTNAAASRSGHTKLPGPGDTAAGNARTRHAGAHYGLESGPPWSPWDDETSDTGKSRLHKTSDDYCGWAIDTPAGRRQPPARYSVSGAKDAARQTQTEVLGVDVPAISVSRAVREYLLAEFCSGVWCLGGYSQQTRVSFAHFPGAGLSTTPTSCRSTV
jgi:hypothetical protein